MSRKLDLDELNKEYIGKTFGWLTVISVYKDLDKKRYYFKCICKCGKETCKPYNKVISGHTSSCGCYKFSKEYSDSLSDYWKTHPDKVELKSNKCSKWCKENPDKVAERGKKHSQFYKDNPDVLVKQQAKRAETFEKNNIQEKINETLRLIWDDKKRSEFSIAKKNYYASHPEAVNKQSETLLSFYKEHPERKTDISIRNKEWCETNKDKVAENGILHSQHLSKIRISLIENSGDNINQLIEVLHPSQVEAFLKGNIKATDSVLIKCSVCGKYETRVLNNVWRFADCRFKNNCKPICSSCLNNTYTSSYECIIADFISTFYNGECIRNSRSIIHPYELDLYYPEKKIAIEFNGDYWHSDKYKSNSYHYNKFKQCHDLGITLVSIFDTYWNESQDAIKSYIKDLFNGVENKLSYIDENRINLNYPPPNFKFSDSNIYKYWYESRGSKVYTCGYADYSLQFLIDTANENNLECFVNDNNDLEIKDKNLCFHLADMLSGELDAYDRWKAYHNQGIRCVFIYPPDLTNEHKVNIYKNILQYHCGLAKRIYARNTEVKVYPAIKMKQFFEENNIAGYRNSRTAYVLEDKKTHEPLMCYLIGHSYFGKGNYDCEIARGACKMGISVTGGASKLWKHIIQNNPDIKSIVYYCDRRQYDQRSIGHLMDSDAMTGLGKVYMLKGGSSFVNYWINDTYYNGKIWHHAGEFKNREPSRHKFVMEAIHNGDCISVYNPGSFVNIFVRKGYHLEGMKVVQDS